MLCWGLVQARGDYVSQRNIKPVFYCIKESVATVAQRYLVTL